MRIFSKVCLCITFLAVSTNSFATEPKRKPSAAPLESLRFTPAAVGFRYDDEMQSFVIYGKNTDGTDFRFKFDGSFQYSSAIFSGCWNLFSHSNGKTILVERTGSANSPSIRGCSIGM